MNEVVGLESGAAFGANCNDRSAHAFHGPTSKRDGTVDLNPHFSTNEIEGVVDASVAGFGIATTKGWSSARTGGRGAHSAVPGMEDGRHSGLRLFSDGPRDLCRRACPCRISRGKTRR